MAEPYDGVAELWWDADLATASEEVHKPAMRALVEDERNFIDFNKVEDAPLALGPFATRHRLSKAVLVFARY